MCFGWVGPNISSRQRAELVPNELSQLAIAQLHAVLPVLWLISIALYCVEGERVV